jgi:nitrite reductase/ring-hydroxylating ferredoxin subunit
LSDEFFVIDDTCTHGEASLSDGELFSNGEVSCPFHGGTFDVRSGAACKYPCVVPIKTYRTRIINNSVWIDLSLFFYGFCVAGGGDFSLERASTH